MQPSGTLTHSCAKPPSLPAKAITAAWAAERPSAAGLDRLQSPWVFRSTRRSSRSTMGCFSVTHGSFRQQAAGESHRPNPRGHSETVGADGSSFARDGVYRDLEGDDGAL